MAEVTVWHRKKYDLIGMNSCYMLGFADAPEINPEEIVLGVQLIRPGDVIVAMEGKYTGAGHTSYRGDGVRYLGTYNDVAESCKFCLFLRATDAEPLSDSIQGWSYLYFAWCFLSETELMFCNTAGAGRIMQTEVVEIAA